VLEVVRQAGNVKSYDSDKFHYHYWLTTTLVVNLDLRKTPFI